MRYNADLNDSRLYAAEVFYLPWMGVDKSKGIYLITYRDWSEGQPYVEIRFVDLHPHQQVVTDLENGATTGRVDTVYVVQSAPKATVFKSYEEADLRFGIYAGATTTRESLMPVGTLLGNYRSVMAAAYGMHGLWSVDYDHDYFDHGTYNCSDQGSGFMVGWTPRGEERDLFIFSGWHWEESKISADAFIYGESINNDVVNGTEGLQLGMTYVSKHLMLTGAATWGADRDINSNDDTVVTYRLSVQVGHSIGF